MMSENFASVDGVHLLDTELRQRARHIEQLRLAGVPEERGVGDVKLALVADFGQQYLQGHTWAHPNHGLLRSQVVHHQPHRLLRDNRLHRLLESVLTGGPRFEEGRPSTKGPQGCVGLVL